MGSVVQSLKLECNRTSDAFSVNRVAIAVWERMKGDRHAMCPVLDLAGRVYGLLHGSLIVVDEDGRVGITPPPDDFDEYRLEGEAWTSDEEGDDDE